MLELETGKQNKILRTISETIKKDEFKEYVKLGKEMIKYIKNPKNGGVGLAAPQVGKNKRLIVVSLPKNWDDENYPTIMMINPLILSHSDEKIWCDEGCLSVPGEKGKVLRWKSLKLSYIDDKGKEITVKLSDLQANIVQHEIDHLDGILFTDRIEKENKPSLIM